MTALRTAAQEALEALEKATRFMSDADYRKLNEAITALRSALAEPVQEPVAWVECDGDLVWNNREAAIGRNLYTSPQPQQTEPSQDTPPQHEYEVTANDDGTFSVGLPDGEELRIIPPQRKPLTEEEIDGLMQSIGLRCADDGNERMANHAEWERRQRRRIARAVERAHKIGGQP